MPTKRKHRFYIDVTYSRPIAMRDAAKGLDLVLRERLDLQKAPVWFVAGDRAVAAVRAAAGTRTRS